MNRAPLQNGRCVSCGAICEDLARAKAHQDEAERRYQQEGFSLAWFGVSLLVMVILTAALVIGVPKALPVFDFEGSAGMLVAIPVWFLGGLLVGLISPGKTFIEPVAAAFLVAIPTAIYLHGGQTVKTMPGFMYILLSALGLLFTLIGSYLGERIQMGPAPTPGQ
jgi:cation transport ATPase